MRRADDRLAYTAGVTTHDIPLFPLSAVLFPGGLLSLRIFEPRYLDLVRDCSRNSSGFGVCLILAGREIGEPATPAAVGTLAHIEDFYTLPDGLLGIRARGSRRFRATATRVRDNGLVHGTVDWLPDEPATTLPPEHSLLAVILERLLEQIGGEHAQAGRHRLDDASWVGFRLAELLPVSADERQHWLQLTDPLQRLDSLLRCMPRFQAD